MPRITLTEGDGMRGNGRVFLRGRYWWIAYSHRGQEYRESSQSDKKAVAQAVLRARLSALEQGLPAYGATRRHTVGALLERLQAEYLRRGGRGPLQYAAHLKPLHRTFGGRARGRTDGEPPSSGL